MKSDRKNAETHAARVRVKTYIVPADKIDAAVRILNTHGDTLGACRDALRVTK